jgi:hypothetical protein
MDFTFPALVWISVVKRNFSPAIINFYGQNFLFLVMKEIRRARRDRVSYGFYISCSGLNFCTEAKTYLQKRTSKNVLPKTYLKKRTSKNVLPKTYLQSRMYLVFRTSYLRKKITYFVPRTSAKHNVLCTSYRTRNVFTIQSFIWNW